MCKIEDHIKHIDEALTMPDNTSVSLKIHKYQLFRESMDYIGHILLQGHIMIRKVEKIPC